MINNLQANLSGFNKEGLELYSEPIDIVKSDLKAINSGSWLEINAKEIKVYSNEFSAKLFAEGRYILLNKDKKINLKSSKKKSLYLKLYIPKKIKSANNAIAKFAISGMLMQGKEELFKIKVYITEKIYLEVVWKKF